jgi:tetratricopeptide (TPR) repeat protein
MLLPAIGLVPLRYYAFADRYTYVPLIGIFIVAVWGAVDLLGRSLYGRIAGGFIAAAVLLTCSICSAEQAVVWHNSYTLWSHALKVDANNVIANTHMGSLLIRSDRCREAEPYFRKAVDVCQRRGYTTAGPYRDLADALWLQGKSREAIVFYLRALEIDPNSGKTHHKVGIGLLGQGKFQDAEEHFLTALVLEPKSPELHANLGAALYNQGRFSAAAAHLVEAVRLRPNYAKGHNMLGMALESQGKLGEAIHHYSQAAQIDPGLSEASRNLVAASEAQRRLNTASPGSP